MMPMTYEEAQEFMRADDHVHRRAREVWMKAERQALAEQSAVLATKQSAQLGYEVVCGCGQKHLVVLTVAVSGRLEGGEDHARIFRVEPVKCEDAGLGGKGEDGQAGLQPQDAVVDVVHSSLRQVGCATDGREGAGIGEAPLPAPALCRKGDA